MSNTLNIDGRDYEIVDFGVKLTNKTIAYRAISLAQGRLAIADNRIYNTISGRPIIRGKFANMKSALKVAKWIEKLLWNYFDIWSSYPEANLVSWCKYTVEGGATLFETVEMLDKMNIISDTDIQDAYQKAKELAKEWRI